MVTRETMTVANDLSSGRDVYYDPSDVDITANPYPIYACHREETPLHHNASYGFWALSRHADVETALSNWATFSNPRRHSRTREVGLRHAQGRDDVRGPAHPHDVARTDVSGVHAAQDGRDRGPDSTVLRQLP
jgi:cytochrome P450